MLYSCVSFLYQEYQNPTARCRKNRKKKNLEDNKCSITLKVSLSFPLSVTSPTAHRKKGRGGGGGDGVRVRGKLLLNCEILASAFCCVMVNFVCIFGI